MTRVMGIVNVTPDSFSDGGRWPDPVDAIAHARRLVEEGAELIDVGGESTRPGSSPVDEATELARTIPVIEALAGTIGDVEISLVLDVSGSMGSNSKLVNLKDAAEDFIDSVYGSSADDSVSTTIVPYSTQVSAGPDILAYLDRSPVSHDNSHCLNFSTTDYATTAISTTAAVEQTLHFDPWTNENSSWRPNNSLWQTPCPTASWTDIEAFSDDPVALKAYVNNFQATNWTSIEIGVKWGAALLDPAFRPVVNGMIAAGDVNAAFTDRPMSYDNAEGLKVMVVMTDGVNTEQYEMDDPYRSGNSFVYVYYDSYDRPYYSIWGGSGEPDPTVQTQTVTSTDWNCTNWYYYNGRWRCSNWEAVTTTTTEEVQNWYLANDYSNDGVSDGWRSAPYGTGAATRMTWDQLWAEVPVEYFTDKFLYNMGYSSTVRNAIEAARTYIGGSEKDTRTLAICSAAKAEGVLIYAIGFEAPYASQVLLAACASSPSHYFNVEGTDISMAFSAIAADINRLRLVQ